MKILGGFIGVVVGYIAWQITIFVVNMLGFRILDAIGISGPRVSANLSAVASILGVIVFILVLIKIYKLFARKESKTNYEKISVDKTNENE